MSVDVEQLLADASAARLSGAARTASDELLIIDPETRQIAVPENFLLGVESDQNVERVRFQCPKIVGDNIDLSKLHIYVNYQNANQEVSSYWCQDVEVEGDNITFSWLVSRAATMYQGETIFIVCAKKSDEEGNLTNEWNTTIPEHGGIVLEGLEPDPRLEQQYPDVIEQILTELDTIKAGGGSYTLPIMSDTQLGGGKAISKTDEDVPVAVDPETGQLFVPTYPENTGQGDLYFEMVSSGSSTTNGVSLDISAILTEYPSYSNWDSLHNWYLTNYNTDIAVSNGIRKGKLVSKPIKGVCYFRGFANSSNQYAVNNGVMFYGCDSDKALEEEGHPCTLIASKKFQYIPVDELPDGSTECGVIVIYPQEEYQYYYIELDGAYYSLGIQNRLNPTWIAAFDSSVLDDPLMSISLKHDTFLKMKDEYLDGYYKNMFVNPQFIRIFKNYYAQMAPKTGILQTFGKAIYIGGDSLHAYAGGDGKSTDGFVTNWNQYLGFSVVTNAGYAGSTWSELTGGGGLKRAKDLISAGTVYDVIILAWGTNDDAGGNGTVDDEASDADGATMVAAMKWIITNLRNAFKNTSIGVIIPPPKNTEDGMQTRGDLMIQVCELLHVPYVDMRQYISISDLGGDTVHLGTGAGKYGAAEASLIMRICQYGDTLYPGNSEST